MTWNLMLMLVWAALTNDFTFSNLVTGFVLGYVVMLILASRGVAGSSVYARRTVRAASFLQFYLLELVLANLRMARDVLRPYRKLTAALIAIPLDIRTDSDAEITLLSNLISLTPGSLSVDVSPDRRTLYVHAMDIPDGDVDRVRDNLKNELERRVLEVLR